MSKENFKASSEGKEPKREPKVVVSDGFTVDKNGRDAWGRDVRDWIQTEPGGKLRPHP